MKTETRKIISLSDWNTLVKQTYGRPYSFQQQDGCKERGVFFFSVPNAETNDYETDSFDTENDEEEMGVSFSAWLKRDPNVPFADGKPSWLTEIWWQRNFYPDVQMVANDLHEKGLLEAGDYGINIDW